ncbi:Maltose excess protein 1 [Abeliophyllum distichum]|uniref:Maltose excess protein 1 n=1 Tax=Abeliophyllum distichum TaxID=126358 RepID=A0ABD1V913_9LAMI
MASSLLPLPLGKYAIIGSNQLPRLTQKRCIPPIRKTKHGNHQHQSRGNNFEQWDSVTAKFAGAANVPFLLLQLPQIILNGRNLLSGNKSALLAVPWLGMFTGLLGNLSLMSYFIKKRETEAVVVQTLGVVSIYVVMLQLAMAEAMPLPHFIRYFHCGCFWSHCEFYEILSFAKSGNLACLGRFYYYCRNLCSSTSYVVNICPICSKHYLAWSDFLFDRLCLVFLWLGWVSSRTKAPNFLNQYLAGVPLFFSCGCLLHKWFTGSSWGCVFYGLGNLICMYCFNSISKEFFLAATISFIAWIGITLWRDTQAYGYSSPFTSLKELVFGP